MAKRGRPRGGPIDPKLGKLVRELREERGMTQAALAGPDFSKGFISLLETGRTRVSLRAAEILSARLGVTPATLLGHDPGYGELAERLGAAERALLRAKEVVDVHLPLVQAALKKHRSWVSGQRKLASEL